MANYDTHVRRGQPVLFVFIVIFSIFELVNAAWLVSRFDLLQDYPSLDVRDRTRFLVFVTSWTILVSLIYFTLFLRTPENGIWTKFHSHAAVVGTTWIFWTTGAVAITVAVGGWLDCGSAVIMYCGPLNALEAFAWLSWTFVTFAFVVVLFRGTSLSGRSEGYQGFGSMG
ncbi:hypothetical protein C8Q76DRAFT_766512 [Earliella scabrosa]|nr:hypothetical protein C8Q76DRAFT_766512 [Earliella scabrosa]